MQALSVVHPLPVTISASFVDKIPTADQRKYQQTHENKLSSYIGFKKPAAAGTTW